MIRDYPLSSKPAWRSIAREVAATLAAGALLPFGVSRRERRTPRRREQHTIVLLHGYMANRSTVFPLAAWLRARGFKQILTYGYDSSAGVDRAALGLKAFLKRNVRGGRVDLVGHSMGGLVARVYLQELGGARRVDRCVTLGTPHKGTYNAYWLWSRVGAELRPDSRLMERLQRSTGRASAVRFASLVAGSDNLVIPRVFAGHEREACLPDLGHVSMLFSPRVLRFVERELSA